MTLLGMMGRMVAPALMLVFAVGCASGTQPALPGSAEQPVEITTTGEPAGPSGPPPVETQDKIISVRISDGRVEGVAARVEVDRGTQVRIEVTSDQRDELHVHGYEKIAPLAPGATAAVALVADVPGVFEVETHDSGLLLFQLVVR
jgi:hypothetical protein